MTAKVSSASPVRPNGAVASRSLAILVPLLLIAFVLALVVQADAQRRQALNETIDGRRHAAAIAAEQANTSMVHAWGALAGAAEVGRLQGTIVSAPAIVAAAATRARPVVAAAVFDDQGRVSAATSGANIAIAAAARRAAQGSATWAGVAEANGVHTPVLTRRVGAFTVVSILDPAKLLPEDAKGARFYLAESGGHILATLPQSAEHAGADVRGLLGKDADADIDGFIGEDDKKAPIAIGVATVTTGNLRVLSAAPTRSPLAEMLRALLRNVLIAAAPILAVGALLLLLRQNQQRAKVAEEEVVRVEKRYRTAADGAKASIFEWNPTSGSIVISDQLAALLRANSSELSKNMNIRLKIC